MVQICGLLPGSFIKAGHYGGQYASTEFLADPVAYAISIVVLLDANQVN